MHDHDVMLRPMGDLMGHVFPGALIGLWGLAWLIWLARRRTAPVVMHRLEAWVKVVLPVTGIVGEARWWAWPFTEGSITTMQHAAMYAAFLLSGITDLLALRGRVTAAAARLALAGAFALAGLLFWIHGGHAELPVVLHRLLALVLGGVALVAALEAFVTPATMLAWTRAFGAILIGTWFQQVGWMLYVAEYEHADPAVLLRAPLFFAVHALGVGALVLAVSQFVRPRAAA